MSEPGTQSLRVRLIRRIGGYSKVMCWYRAHRPRWLWRLTSSSGRSTSRYIAQNGLEVKRGPFKGIRFLPEAVGHTNYLASKLSGNYERDVVGLLEENAKYHDLFVDLGSGDGFFCVGVAGVAEIQSIGFELNEFESRIAQLMSSENRLLIETRGPVNQSQLNALPDGRLLLLSDIEGYEEELLDPVQVPRLRQATMIVEVHENVRPNVVKTLHDRFAETHHIERVFSTEPDFERCPELKSWSLAEAKLAIFDGHVSGDSWMSFVPR